MVAAFVIFGVLGAGIFAACLSTWSTLSAFEKDGGSVQLNTIVALLYRIGGKPLALGPLIVLSLAFAGLALKALVDLALSVRKRGARR